MIGNKNIKMINLAINECGNTFFIKKIIKNLLIKILLVCKKYNRLLDL